MPDTNMLSFFTKTSSVLKMVNKDGLQAAQSLAPISVMMDQMGMNGESAGNALRKVIQSGLSVKKIRDVNKVMARQKLGVQLDFTDGKGSFGGLDNMFRQLAKLRKLTDVIAGRSLTADLIDCAAEPTQFNGRSLVQIAQALAAPFGIEVVNSGAPSGVIPDVQPDHGETVIEVINKILGQQQALAYDDPHGRLVIGGIGSTRAHTALVLGENILSCDTEKSIRERFSVYQVAGQRAGNDDDFGEATTTALRARTEDAFIARYRPMYIRQTGQATGAGCIARADFEARQRAARTDETTYVVQGWRQGNGTLWQPNQRVIVFDPVCGFDNTELLVSEVTFTQDQNGTLTEIRVGPPDAYLPEPEAPGARKKKKARVQEDPF
ncbi:baseplate protein [Escherichia coli]|nr:baseplate protein [Escherichia coli]URV22498.1 baseplate protein [Escherichia coli]